MHRLLTWQFEKLICIHAFDSPTCCRWTLKKTPQGWQNVHISGENAGNPQVWTELHPSGKHFCAVRFSCCAGTGQNSTGEKKSARYSLSVRQRLQALTAPGFWSLENTEPAHDLPHVNRANSSTNSKRKGCVYHFWINKYYSYYLIIVYYSFTFLFTKIYQRMSF